MWQNGGKPPAQKPLPMPGFDVKRTYEGNWSTAFGNFHRTSLGSKTHKGCSQTEEFPADLSQFAPTTDFLQKNTAQESHGLTIGKNLRSFAD
jgi:hypothetical protein